MLPEEVIAELNLSPGQNLQEIGARHECFITVLGQEHSVNGERPVLAKGRRSSLYKAKNDVLDFTSRLLGKGATTLPTVDPKQYGPALIRAVYTGYDVKGQRRADQIPQPDVWTRDSFALYVHELCNMLIPRSVHRVLYSPEEEHRYVVSRILLDLFSDPAMKDIITIYAFDQVLDFFEEERLVDYARRFFVLGNQLGLTMHPRTFNIILKGPAREGNVSAFRYILQLMTDRGLQPTAETWLRFLMIDQTSTSDKLYILQRMEERELLQYPPIFWMAVAQVTSALFSNWLDLGKDSNSFLSAMDCIWGSQWLSTSSANRVLNELAKRGLYSSMLKVWDVFRKRAIPLNNVSLNTLLYPCVRKRKIQRSIRALQLAHSSGILPDEMTYDILMKLVRKNNHFYNVGRVLWRYGCMEGRVKRATELWVRRSLLWAFRRRRDRAVAKTWALTAGIVIVGLKSSDVLPLVGTDAQTFDSEKHVMALLSEWLHDSNSGRRKGAATVGERMLQRDLDSFQAVRPVWPLWQMLEQALALDNNWAQSNKKHSVRWKLDNAIDVPYRYRG